MSLSFLIPRMDAKRLHALQEAAPDASFRVAKNPDAAMDLAPGIDAAYGFCTRAFIEKASGR